MHFSGILAAKVLGGLTVVGVPSAVGVAYITGAIGNSSASAPETPVKEQTSPVPLTPTTTEPTQTPPTPKTPTESTDKQKVFMNLGLSSSDCGEAWNSDECQLTKDSWKKINFSNGTKDGFIVSEASEEDVKLKIELAADESIFPKGIKVVLEGLSSGDSVEAKNGDDTMEVFSTLEFKVEENNNKYWLTDAWDAKKLGAKVGCTISESESKIKCTLEKGRKIKIRLDDEGKDREVVLKDAAVFTIEKDPVYIKGIKFTASSDIEFEADVDGTSSDLKTKISEEDPFEIKWLDNDWFFWGDTTQYE